jgi:hypothetical protein
MKLVGHHMPIRIVAEGTLAVAALHGLWGSVGANHR